MHVRLICAIKFYLLTYLLTYLLVPTERCASVAELPVLLLFLYSFTFLCCSIVQELLN